MERRSQNSLVLAEMQKLASSLFLDLKTHHPHLNKNLILDEKTLIKRSSSEGISFLTQTLPILAKSLLRGLESGVFICPKGFRKRKGTELPRFLGGFLKCVFNDDGKLAHQVDESAIVDFLEITNLFYKLDLPYSPEKENNVIKNFIETEKQLKELQIEDSDILNEAADLVERILKGFDPFDITPRHGPGAVATREKGVEKWNFKTKYTCIHKVYPYYEYFLPSRSLLLQPAPFKEPLVRRYKSMDQQDFGCARVTLVPKDSRGPRLISMEPLEFQFIQQGIARSLVEHLEKSSRVTSGFVNFTNQSINQSLARYNSVSRSYATLDMKDASDRVSLQLVRKIFSKRPDVLKCLEATRSQFTELPSGEVLQLEKFAPMGSALCFPVEALVFFTLAEVIRKRDGIVGRVYVYGDDIIVPRELAPILFGAFPKYGLRFNEDKCFMNGYFRESCGMDAYKGYVCTPVRMRKRMPRSRKEASALVSGIELSNYLFLRGYWNASAYVKNVCENIQHVGVLRSPKENFGGLSYVSFTTKGVMRDSTVRIRFEKGTQRFQILTPVTKPVTKLRKWKDSATRLFSNLVGQFTLTDTVPHAVTIQMRWVPIL